MRDRGERRAAMAAVAAAAGAGWASGCELVLFFGQLGGASWVSAAFAPVCWGLLLAGLCRWAARVGADTPEVLFERLLGRRAGRAAALLHGLLMSLTAAVMLVSAGEVGALALPLGHGWLWGLALGLAAALGICLDYRRAMPAMGAATLALGAGFYLALALDLRPARIYARAETTLALEDSAGAAVLLAALYACMNAALAADAALRCAGPGARPGRLGALSGGAMGLMLACANAAIRRGGRDLLSQAMPTVILAARWGATGFWLCAAFTFLCAVGTLAAALMPLGASLGGGGRARGALLLLLTAILTAFRGMDGAVARAYPALGWVCALGVAALAGALDKRR